MVNFVRVKCNIKGIHYLQICCNGNFDSTILKYFNDFFFSFIQFLDQTSLSLLQDHHLCKAQLNGAKRNFKKVRLRCMCQQVHTSLPYLNNQLRHQDPRCLLFFTQGVFSVNNGVLCAWFIKSVYKFTSKCQSQTIPSSNRR